ncbi:MAG: hypothetical protein QM504_04330 [Pseudomonadota bacterium]
MGILNELRDEAERKKILDQQSEITADNLADNYQQNILPKMQMIFNFFKEIVEHLQFIQEPISVINYSNKYPDLGKLIQQDYKLSTDKHGGMSHYNELMDINVRFYCMGDESMELELKSQPEIEQQINFLTAKKISFEWSRQHDAVTGSYAIFIIEKKIPVKINFHVDYENSRINLEIFNHHNFGHIKRSYMPDEINDALLDQLAKFLLRKDNDFIKIEMSEKDREALRENLRQNINFDSRPISNEQQLNEAPEKGKNQGLFSKISSMFK